MEKKIKVGDREVLFKATALTPTLYRRAFPDKDLFKDLMSFRNANGGTEDEVLESVDMSIFERLTYVMSEDFRKGISFEDFLESFEVMDIVSALPDVMELWDSNMVTQSISKNV